MSVKHVKDYYDQVTANYLELRSDLEDMEKLAETNQMSPEQVEQMKLIIAPVKQNYETLSYFMYLLNQPNKKSKQPTYKKQNKKFVEASGKRTQIDIITENKKSLSDLKELKEDIQ